MKKILINVNDSKYKFFLELVGSLDFAHVVNEKEASIEFLKNDLTEAFNELDLIKKGKLKAKNAKDLFDEL